MDPISGQQLVHDFQSVYIAVATAAAAHHEAEHSEHAVVEYLARATSGTFLNPSVIAQESQPSLTKASLDAHVKKVQAEQIQAFSDAQIQQQNAKVQILYRGRKVQINVLTNGSSPIESIWLDKRTGYRQGVVQRARLTGVIQEIHLDKNLLVVLPTRLPRLVNPNLKQYLVYIIDPLTLTPMVELTLI
jgi:hypothetical protein